VAVLGFFGMGLSGIGGMGSFLFGLGGLGAGIFGAWAEPVQTLLSTAHYPCCVLDEILGLCGCA